jgi:heptosyltransferase-1
MKILIIKLSALGDIVHTIPALSLIKKNLPNAQIDWVIYEKFSGILKGSKYLNKIHGIKNKSLNEFFKTAKILETENYDLVIDFQGLTKTGFLSLLSGSKKRLGFKQAREFFASYFYNLKSDQGNILDNSNHIIEKNLKLALAGLYNTGLNQGKELEFDFDHLKPPTIFLKEKTNKVCLIPSTTWETKFWTKENWVEVLKYVFEKNKSTVYIIGTESDLIKLSDLISSLQRHGAFKLFKNNIPLNPQNSSNYHLHICTDKKLEELPDFFREMDTIIGVDTGPLHIASASCFIKGNLEQDNQNFYFNKEVLEKKIIGLFGPSSGKRSGPYGFEYLSADELTGLKARQNRKVANKINMMQFIKAQMVIDRL